MQYDAGTQTFETWLAYDCQETHNNLMMIIAELKTIIAERDALRLALDVITEERDALRDSL